jgi:hypothetical protein
MLNLRLNRGCSFDAESGISLPFIKPGCRGELAVEMQAPGSDQIQRRCRTIRRRWSPREELLRKFRAKMACQFGVFRNH